MIYGDQKVKQMCRSILPSSARRSARYDKRRIHQRERRAVSQILHEIDSYDSAEDCDADLVNPVNFGWYGMNDVIYNRRGADKVAPFERWAVARTKDINEPVDRLNYIKSLLPENLIGRHAITHVEFLDEFKVDYDHVLRYFRHVKEHDEKGDIAKALLAALSDGRHKEINRILKEDWRTGHYSWRKKESVLCPVCFYAPRLLQGTDDVHVFVEDWFSREVGNRRRTALEGEIEHRSMSLKDHGHSWGSLVVWLKKEGYIVL